MRYEDNNLEISAAAIGPSGHYGVDASATCRCSLGRDGSGLVWPPDALTRLLMDADGVPERVLERLLQRIAAAQATH